MPLVCVRCNSETARHICCCRRVFYCGRKCQKRHWKEHRDICKLSIVVHSLSAQEHVIECPTKDRVRDLRNRAIAQLGISRYQHLQFQLHGQILENHQHLAKLNMRTVDDQLRENQERPAVVYVVYPAHLFIVLHSMSAEKHVVICPAKGRVSILRRRLAMRLGISRETGHQLLLTLHGQILEDHQRLAELDMATEVDHGAQLRENQQRPAVVYVVQEVSECSMPSMWSTSSEDERN